MKKIFNEEVIHILPARDNGVIAVIAKEQVNDNIVVAYQMYSFDTGQADSVTRFVYLLNKFGNHHKQCERQLKDYLTCFTILLPGNRIMVVYPTGAAGVFEEDGEIFWHGDLLYNEHGPADGVLVGDKLWFSFPQGNTVICYDLETMRYELRIGGNQTPLFISPEGLTVTESGTLLVCNPLANKIREIDLENYKVEEYLVFEEPVYQYVKIHTNEVVRLESGVYLL